MACQGPESSRLWLDIWILKLSVPEVSLMMCLSSDSLIYVGKSDITKYTGLVLASINSYYEHL